MSYSCGINIYGSNRFDIEARTNCAEATPDKPFQQWSRSKFFIVLCEAVGEVAEQERSANGETLQISEAQNKTAKELVDLVAGKLGSGRAVHPETAIASTARLAGSLLFRSFGLNVADIQPGTAVLSDVANEEGPELINIMSAMLHHFGVTLNQERLSEEASRSSGAVKLSVVESLALLQNDAMHIVKANELELKEAAQAAALATAFVVKECSRNLGIEVSFNIATYGFIEGCKTMPPAISSKPISPGQKKPWYKLW